MIGKVYTEAGLLTSTEAFKLVKKVGAAGMNIDKHKHPGVDVIFTVVKGKVEVCLQGEEMHVVQPGDVLHFDGENTIEAQYLEASEVIVTLIKK